MTAVLVGGKSFVAVVLPLLKNVLNSKPFPIEPVTRLPFIFLLHGKFSLGARLISQVLEAAVHHEAIVGYDAAHSENKRLSGKANETKL